MVVNLEKTIGEHTGGGTWEDLDNSGVDLSNPAVVNFKRILAGTYDFRYTVSDGSCSKSSIVSVQICDEPTVSATTMTVSGVCTGSMVTLSAVTDGTFIEWRKDGMLLSSTNTYTINSVSSAYNGTYIVTAFNECGLQCSASDSVVIDIEPEEIETKQITVFT